MDARRFTLILGIAFLVTGIAGFIPALVTIPPEGSDAYIALNAQTDMYAKGFGYLFGLFPINFMHNIVHILFGIIGIITASSFLGARAFDRVFAISYLGIAVLGLFPLTRTLFGTMPLFGNDVWFHVITALPAAYFGFAPPEQTQIGTEA
jgi:hypothetical protein